MIRLKDEELQNLSAITEVPVIHLRKLISTGVLTEDRAIDFLVMYDFRKLRRRGQYRLYQIYEAIARKYNIKPSRVTRLYRIKNRKQYFCESCGTPITKGQWMKGHCKCAKCVVSDIEI